MTDNKAVLNDIFGSDSDEDEGNEAQPTTTAAASSSDDDEDLAAAAAAAKEKQKFVSSLEQERDSDDEDGVGAEGVGVAPKPRQRNDGPPLVMEAPLMPLPDENRLKMFKLSNILGVAIKPFDPETYDEEEEIIVDEKTGMTRVKLRHNIIRWRWATNEAGEQVPQSNARFVRWSDGSIQLMLGDEVLDIAEQDTSRDNSHLFVRHPGLVQSLGPLKSKMNFRPSSLDSRSHKQLTAIVDKRHAKTNKLQRMLVMHDPDRDKDSREKVEEQRNKDRMDLMQKQANIMEKGGYDRGGYSSNYSSYAYMDEDDDDVGQFSLDGARSAIAGARSKMPAEDEEANERRILNAKREVPTSSRKRQVDSDDEEEPRQSARSKAAALEDSSDEDLAPKQRNPKRARQVTLDSGSDSD